jgi:hypothetical protein
LRTFPYPFPYADVVFLHQIIKATSSEYYELDNSNEFTELSDWVLAEVALRF